MTLNRFILNRFIYDPLRNMPYRRNNFYKNTPKGAKIKDFGKETPKSNQGKYKSFILFKDLQDIEHGNYYDEFEGNWPKRLISRVHRSIKGLK